MPELPEVETVRRGLHEQLTGRAFVSLSFVEWLRTLETPPEQIAARLAGRQVRGVRRRAKFLVIELDGGEHLIIHLRMTGIVRVVPAETARDRHERVAFALAGGDELRFSDIRRFGRIALLNASELADRFGALGPEPLGDDLTAAEFATRLAARRTRLKPLLLDQSFLAGLGNIYVDEALHRAGLHPLASAAVVTPAQAVALYGAIRDVLSEAIASGGTTFSNYRDAYGQAGDYYERRRVYGRADQPCPACGAAIARIVVGGRGTHFCPHCQPEAIGEAAGQVIPFTPRPALRQVAEQGAGYTVPDES